MKPIYEDDDQQNDKPKERLEEEKQGMHSADLHPRDDDTEEKKDPGHKSADIRISINKKRLKWTIAGVILVLVALACWQFKVFAKAYDWYSSATLSTQIIEMDSHKAIAGATVKVNGKTVTSDNQGSVNITNLKSGSTTIQVSKDGFTTKNVAAQLYRGDNPIDDIVLEKAPEKVLELKGTVTDIISGSALPKAKVTAGDKSVTSDDSGAFTLTVGIDVTKVQVTKDGYVAGEAVIKTSKEGVADPIAVGLLPVKSIVFEQERSGKVDLYSTDFSGSSAVALTDGKLANSSRNPLVSPDGLKIAFLSDRDGVLVSSQTANKLYLLDEKGNVSKLSDDLNPSGVCWIGNSYVAYYYQLNTSPSQYALVAYRLSDKKRIALVSPPDVTTVISTSFDFLVSSPDGQFLVYHQNASTGVSSTDAIKAQTDDLKGIFKVNSDGTNLKRLTKGDKDYISDLYFVNGSGEVRYAVYLDSGMAVKGINLSSGQENLVTSKGIWGRDYALNNSHGNSGEGGVAEKYQVTLQLKNNRYVYIDTRNGKTDAFVADANGGSEVQLTSLGDVKSIVLSPDEKYVIAGTLSADGTHSLYAVGVSGGTAKKITDSYSFNAGFFQKP